MTDIPSTLRAVELLTGLAKEDIQAVARLGEIATFHKEDLIVQKGDRSDELYIILSGQVDVITQAGENETSLVHLGAGQSFGEMALIDAGPRSASIRCVSSTADIMIIKRDDLIALWDKKCHVGFKMMSNIARDLAFKLRVRNIATTM
ncbi:MAG: cyclic nucleotide-binding domain-containing protein [Anaerolineae bacterium]|nr:cyclic nucleotide-binding domain-containing protein [Anaerolineae bacterium]